VYNKQFNPIIQVQIRMQGIKRMLLAGGGTAGHVNPALAIGSALATAETRLLYVGVRGRVEEEVVPREGIPIKFITASGFPGRLSPKMASFLLKLFIGTLQSLFILLRFRPDIIIGTGGYVSAPVIMAAAMLRNLRLGSARILLHEQNAIPGKLNLLMGRFASQVLVTFPETLSYFPSNGVVVGYPLRKRIAKVSRAEALRKLDLQIPQGRKVVLVFGGSQGARTINQALVDALGHFLPYRDSLFIIHGVGLFRGREYNALQDTEERLQRAYSKEQRDLIREFYVYRAFFHDIENLYAVSDLVVARGGAGSLNEISAMELPALIIPKSNLPGDHQVMNARSMEKAGGAAILYEQISSVNGRLVESIDGKVFADTILALIQDEARLQSMRQSSSSFLNKNALAQIHHLVYGEGNAAPLDPAPAAAGSKDPPLPGNRALLALLEKAYEKHRNAYGPETVIPKTQDLEYLKNRASALLVHPAWQERNLGVKLIGLLQAKEKIPMLLTLFHDRRPASLLKRLFGGDFEQVGFIRRNLIVALVRINELSPEIEDSILLGMEDPYYEVRAESAHAAAFFGERLSAPDRFISKLLQLLEDSNIDVCTAAAEALGRLGGEHDALPALLALWDSKFWRMRTAVLRGILHIVERGKVTNLDAVETQVPKFILTSTDFRPHFEIKFAYMRLMESVSRKKEKSMTP
jgi:UDP-N-acetylglucosamine--N-acetylmuramyl-(pentapeptide) pyrophosphoryl-undecaprenol N-acetylglucosamine transferase